MSLARKQIDRGLITMSDKYFCPKCGVPIAPEDKFCLNCGTSLTKSTRGTASKAQFRGLSQQEGIPKENYVHLKARYFDRFIALLLDGIVYDLCPPLWCFRDVIPEKGKSFGKSMLNLTVVDYDTGLPITIGQSCVRTICLGVLFGIDFLTPLCNDEGRRIGDYVANTIVLEDR